MEQYALGSSVHAAKVFTFVIYKLELKFCNTRQPVWKNH